MLRTLRDRLKRLGAAVALLVTVVAMAPMAQALVCDCDPSEVASAVAMGSDAGQSAADQSSADEPCACVACHCCHVGSDAQTLFKIVTLAVFAVEPVSPLNDERLLPAAPNALERPPRV